MSDYSSLKVAELRTLLKERGIPSTGLIRKQQIINALKAQESETADDNGPDDTEQPTLEDAVDGNAANAAPVTNDTATEVEEAAAEEEPEQDAQESAQTKPGIGPELDEQSSDEKDEPIDAKLAADQAASGDQDHEATSDAPSPENTTKPGVSSDNASPEGKKRKRRSPSPVPSAGSVSKKLKMDNEDLVKLPEDTDMKDLHLVVKTKDDEKQEVDLDVERMDTKDVGDNGKHEQQESVKEDVINTDQPSSPGDIGMDDKKENPIAPEQTIVKVEQDQEELATPSLHPPTSALYTRNLVRPLQPNQLREHLVHLATSPGDDANDAKLLIFHLDSLRSHALILFDSKSAAVRVRDRLHDRIWPDEFTRKALWVDFIPEDRVQEWIDVENAGGNRRDTKRWEVTYNQTADGVKVSHQEASSLSSWPLGTSGGYHTSATGTGTGLGMPNAPTGPRGNRRPSASAQPPNRSHKPAPQPQVITEASNFLDQNFRFTTAKPKIYFLPVSSDLVDRRLDELDSLTSRDWNPRRSGSFTFDHNPRRFTFEDGDRLVDGGPDIGNFGRRTAGAPLIGGGGRPRGRGRP